jgi:GTP-binding protein HflX
LLVPHDRYDVIARLHATGHVQNEEQRDDGVLLRGRFPPTQAAFFAPFVVQPKPARKSAKAAVAKE